LYKVETFFILLMTKYKVQNHYIIKNKNKKSTQKFLLNVFSLLYFYFEDFANITCLSLHFAIFLVPRRNLFFSFRNLEFGLLKNEGQTHEILQFLIVLSVFLKCFWVGFDWCVLESLPWFTDSGSPPFCS
jgi:hypothetical protein